MALGAIPPPDWPGWADLGKLWADLGKFPYLVNSIFKTLYEDFPAPHQVYYLGHGKAYHVSPSEFVFREPSALTASVWMIPYASYSPAVNRAELQMFRGADHGRYP